MARPSKNRLLDDETEEDYQRDLGDPNAPLPQVRNPNLPISPNARMKIEDSVRRAVRQHGVLRIACDACGIDPEVFDGWMREDQYLARKIAKDLADCATADMLEVKKGGRGFPAAKAAFERLGRMEKEWTAKSRTTLETQLTEALEELERTETPEVYTRIVKVLAKHA